MQIFLIYTPLSTRWARVDIGVIHERFVAICRYPCRGQVQPLIQRSAFGQELIRGFAFLRSESPARPVWQLDSGGPTYFIHHIFAGRQFFVELAALRLRLRFVFCEPDQPVADFRQHRRAVIHCSNVRNRSHVIFRTEHLRHQHRRYMQIAGSYLQEHAAGVRQKCAYERQLRPQLV